ncbi:unnamed protein product [Euphydryas editha]|uniref:Reverse transcriptase domain-containing protein n=1 Tax=Euphydryas editha TaxID=104508 RepID=A0AAU9UAP7_EUPED|nr:unnamed protein product [Euphydryas editha]
MRTHKNKRRYTQRLHVLPLKVHLSNIRGLHSNLESVHHHLETEKPQLLFLTETQIRCPADTAYLSYPGYSLEHRFIPRAGVCVYVRDDICIKRLKHLETSSYSILWVLVDTGQEKILYACVYRSHSGDVETTQLCDHLTLTADEARERYPSAQLVILGDFNAHHQEWLYPYQVTDHARREVRKLALTLDLTQLVNCATRVPDVDSHTANCLDLFLTTDPDSHSITVSAPLGTSDHCLVKSISVCSPPEEAPCGLRRVWRYKAADWDEMRHFFSSYPWREVCFSSDDPSSCAEAITAVIHQGMEYFIPYSDVATNGKARPWFDADCYRAEAEKRTAYTAWAEARAHKSPNSRNLKKAFNQATKSCKRTLRRAKFNHISHIGAKLASYPSGSKAFWSLAKAAESNFCRPSLPPLLRADGSLAHSAKEKADLFASLFTENSRLDAAGKAPPISTRADCIMAEVRIRQNEILKILQTLDVNKASGPDGVPAIVLRTCALELSPPLTRLYRLSLKTGKVPKSWKLANVQPVPKKGSRADPVNYRPISVTSILCKTMERALNNKLLAHLEGNDLLSDRQYGFRQNRSTGDLLVYATHIWSEAIDKHGEALAVSLDISKAFDRVWHASLISKLPSYGIPPGLCAWISDFLNERSIRVVLDGYSSDQKAIDAGVPQGLVLSATLFLLHINDLLVPGTFGYADDSTVTDRYFSSARASKDVIQSCREEMVSRLNVALQAVSEWGDANLVTFNATKTQACVFSSKRSPLHLAPTFRNVSVEITDSLQLLGVELSSNLNFGQHIESKAKTAAKKLGILSKVRR